MISLNCLNTDEGMFFNTLFHMQSLLQLNCSMSNLCKYKSNLVG